MQSNYNGRSTGKQPSYSEFTQVAPDISNPDSATVMAVLFSLNQTDLIILEYVGKAGRGITVEELMPVLGLSNAATSIRLRKLSESGFKGIEIELVRRVREGEKGANLHYLNGVTLEVIQSVMTRRGFSYEKYWARKKKVVNPTGNDDVDANAPDNKNTQEQEVSETCISEPLQSDLCSEPWNELTTNEAEPLNTARSDADINALSSRSQMQTVEAPELPRQNETVEKETEITESSSETKPDIEIAKDTDNGDVQQIVLARLIQEIVDLKQGYSHLRQENTGFKEEIISLESRLVELEQKQLSGSNNKLLAKLDQLLTLNQIQNGKNAN